MSEISNNEIIEALHQLAYPKELNVFNVLNNAEHEIRHSSFLAWLFDPEENHGFKNKFAVKFFSAAFQGTKYENENWEERFSEENFNWKSENAAYIDTEVPADQEAYKKKKAAEADVTSEGEMSSAASGKNKDSKKRIDILIKGKDFTCTIENKTFSGEHDEQCQTYKSFIETHDEYKTYDNYFIYLGINEPENFYLSHEDYGRALIEKINKEIDKINENIRKKQNDIDKKRNAPEEKKREIEDKKIKIEDKKREIEDKKKEIEDKKKEIEGKKKEIENKEKNPGENKKKLAKEIKILDRDIQKLEKDIKKDIKKVNTIEKDISTLDSKINKLEGEIKQLEDNHEETEKEIKTLEESIKKDKNEIEKLEEEQNKLEQRVKLKHKLNPYDGYAFVSYKTVIKILEELLQNKSVKSEIRKLIEQYLVGLNRFYGKVDKNTEQLCNMILKDKSLVKAISEYKSEHLTPKLISGKRLLHDYLIYIQKKNDEFIEKVLNDLVVDECKGSISYHDGSSNKTDPYANTFLLNENYGKSKDFLNQIDYPAKFARYSLSLHFAIDSGLAKNCQSYLQETKDFYERLSKIASDRNWEINLIFEVLTGYGTGPRLWQKFFRINKDNAKELFEKIAEKGAVFQSKRYEKNKLMNGDAVNEEFPELQMMKSVLLKDEYDSVKKCIYNYFTADKDKNAMTIRRAFKMEYHFNFLDGKPIITENDRKKIRDSVLEGYYEKTKEGLDLFGLGDAFVSKVFRPRNDPE